MQSSRQAWSGILSLSWCPLFRIENRILALHCEEEVMEAGDVLCSWPTLPIERMVQGYPRSMELRPNILWCQCPQREGLICMSVQVTWVQHSEIGSLIMKGTGLKLGPGVRHQLDFSSPVRTWLLSLIIKRREPLLSVLVLFSLLA